MSFADKFPKVLSCVKGESDDFTLHLVTLIEQNENGTVPINYGRWCPFSPIEDQLKM